MAVGYTGIPDSLYVTPNYNPLIGGNEFIESTTWVPGHDYGVVPYDIIAMGSSKIYVYGDRQILQIDPETKLVVDQIDISKYSNTTLNRFFDPKLITENRMAKDEAGGILYAVTEDLKIIAINTNNYNDIIMTSEPAANPNDPWRSANLKYDSKNDKLYLMINAITASNLYIYNTGNLEVEHEISFQSIVYSWFINPNPYRDVFYVSADGKFAFYSSIDDYELIGDIEFGYEFSTMVYAEDWEFDYPKIYCFPHDVGEDIKIINANIDNVVQTITTTSNGYIAGTYNPVQQKVYAIYRERHPEGKPGYATINAMNDYSCASHDLENEDILLDCMAFGSKTILTGENDLFYIGDNGVTLNTVDGGGAQYSFKMKVCMIVEEEGEIAYVTNLRNPEVIVLDSDCEIEANISVGAFNTYGLYASVSDQIYFYGVGFGSLTKLYSFNTSQEQITEIELGFEVSAITYNETEDAIYVTGFNDATPTTSIKKIDCATNEFLPEGTIDLNYPECSGLYCTPDNKLYISVRHAIGSSIQHILIYDLDNPGIVANQPQGFYSSEYRAYTNFEFDPISNKMFVALREFAGGDDGIVFCFSNNSYERFYSVGSPAKMRCNPLENKLYVLHANFEYNKNYISVIKIDEETVSEIYLPDGDDAIDIEIGLPFNNLYVTKHDNNSTIEVLDCSSDEFVHPKNIDGVAYSLQFNSINNKLYVFTPWDFADNNQMKISSINFNTNEVNAIELDIYHPNHPSGAAPPFKYKSYKNSMVITNDNNLYLPTSQHSNIIKIKCEDDVIGLRPNMFNWVSYPRLQRPNNNPDIDAPVNTENFLSNMYPFPNRLDQYGKDPNTTVEVHVRYKNGTWTNINLENTFSTRGYKIETSNSGITYIPMTGTRLAPDHEITLYPGREKENWVGYFVPYPQNPLEALSSVLPDMVMARGYDWTIVDIGGSMEPVWHLTPADAVIQYGEMAIIETHAQKTFKWFRGKQEIEKQTNNPENFQYEETTDYTAFIIEPDTANLPLEIGVFVNDSCVGACVVEVGDSLVLLRGYMPAGEGDSVVFESYYGARSVNNQKIDGYYVFDKEKNRKERRTIKTGENKRFYLVSFNKKEGQEIAQEGFAIHVYPNPTTGILNIELENLSVSKYAVHISVFDQFGRRLFETVEKNAFPGTNFFQIDLSDETD
ncbi:MAG: hypothetical protein DRJ05_14145, partial [Bacteroidetes bacterium]